MLFNILINLYTGFIVYRYIKIYNNGIIIILKYLNELSYTRYVVDKIIIGIINSKPHLFLIFLLFRKDIIINNSNGTVKTITLTPKLLLKNKIECNIHNKNI